MKFKLSFLGLAGGLALLAACSSTPQWRITENPAAFARLAPGQQQLVREGKIGIGFDATAVRLALGEPDRIREHTDVHGVREVWSYVTDEGVNDFMFADGYYPHHYAYISPNYAYYDVPAYAYPIYPVRRGSERFRVVFKDGKVISFETKVR